MRGGGGGPQAESVVVLGRDDRHAESGVAQRVHPLVGVESVGPEQRGILRAVAPFAVGEGVDAEMQEGGQLQLLPSELLPGGDHAAGDRGPLFGGSAGRQGGLFHVETFAADARTGDQPQQREKSVHGSGFPVKVKLLPCFAKFLFSGNKT